LGASGGRDIEAVCARLFPSNPEVVDFEYLTTSPKGAMVARAPTIRLWHVPYRIVNILRPRTYVFFGWGYPGTPRDTFWPLPVVLPWDDPVPSDAPTRIVLNINVVPRHETWICYQVKSWSTVSELVAVFNRRMPSESSLRDTDQLPGSGYEIVDLVSAWARTPRFTITFVNIDLVEAKAGEALGAIRKTVRKHCPLPEAATIRECFEHLGAHLAPNSTSPMLTFLTLDEYKAKVGAKQFYIETDEDYVVM
jgi:hypothetical protein